jgi:endonuclease/exonuclease/phosphatase family metal-dependent hydrolase
MANTFRISTFNCENLFSRPKVMNFDDDKAAKKPLSEVVKLDQLLSKPKYTAQDKATVFKMVHDLKDWVDLNEMRKKLISTHKVNGKMVEYVKAEGRGDWVGGLVLRRDDLVPDAQISTAEVIKAVNADVQCVVEIEDRLTLEHFSEALLKGQNRYPWNMLIDGNDDRGIDVGVLSKLPIQAARTHIFDPNGAPRNPKGKRIFSRDCLEVDIVLPNGKTLHLLVNHFKSKLNGGDAKRTAQAAQLVEILKKHDLSKDLVVVAGDFNDTPTSKPLASLLGLAGLVDVLAKKFPNAPQDQWTYKDKKQIDYLLVSTVLAAKMADAGVERRGLFDAEKLTKKVTNGPVKPFPSVKNDKTDASDHSAVWAEFTL